MSKRRVLPPVYFLLALTAAVVLDRSLPMITIVPGSLRIGGIVIAALGLAFVVLPARVFQSRGTAIRPFEASWVLVTDGFFAISRNPMYLGMVIAVFGLAIYLGGAWPFVAPAALIAVLQVLFIRHEERMLEGEFGDLYVEYRRRVRRWI